MKARYTEWITEDGLLRIKGWARDGLTDEQIARHHMNIHPSTLYDWINKHPKIGEALKEGRAPVETEIEYAGMRAAKGYWIEETDTEIIELPDGTQRKKIFKRKRWVKPEPALVCYYLNNRKPDRYSNQPRIVAGQAMMEKDPLTIAFEALENDG